MSDFGAALLGGAAGLGSTVPTGDPIVELSSGQLRRRPPRPERMPCLTDWRRRQECDAAQVLFHSMVAEVAAVANEEERARVVAE